MPSFLNLLRLVLGPTWSILENIHVQLGRMCILLLNWMFYMCLLLLLLSHFSRVQLCATPETAAHQAPPSLGFSGKNTGVGWHFLLQCMKVKSESEVAQSWLTLCDPTDRSPPGSSIHGIFQARVLEWGAIAFSFVMLVRLNPQTEFPHPQHLSNNTFPQCTHCRPPH